MTMALTARRLALILGALAVVATLLDVGVPRPPGPASAFAAALHLIRYALVPTVGVVVLARGGGGPRGRVGLLVLAAHGVIHLPTVVFFIVMGIGWEVLASPAGLALVLPVAAAVAALAGLRSAPPWLASDVRRHPARLTAAAGAAMLGLSAWLPAGAGARLGGYPYWPSAELISSLAMLAAIAVILCAADARDAAAVSAVGAIHAAMSPLARLGEWVAPATDVILDAPGWGTLVGALSAVVLGAGALLLLRDNASSRVAANPNEPARRRG